MGWANVSISPLDDVGLANIFRHFALTFMAKSSLNLHARQLKALMTYGSDFILAC